MNVRSSLPLFYRLPILVMALIALLAGVLGGLARLGVALPQVAADAPGGHGALMVAAFFGTVIGLERAVALGRPWPYFAPLAAGAAGIALLVGAPVTWVAWLFISGSLVFVAANVLVVHTMPALFTTTLLLGAVSWLLGNVCWMFAGGIATALPFWMGFLILTIAAERLELTRLMPPRPWSRQSFVLILLVLAIGYGLTLAFSDLRCFAFALGLLAFWLWRYDIARYTVRQQGLPRYIAWALLVGYGWLGLGALLGINGAFALGHLWRDAALHAVFVGFVFSMVFGHAPIILPAVAKVRIRYSSLFYLPLLALHMSLVIRVVATLADAWTWHQWGGRLNALALVLFFGILLFSLERQPRRVLRNNTNSLK